MKRQEVHLLNRIYVYPPSKKILPYFGDAEDIIDPYKVIAILDQLDKMKYDETHKEFNLQLQIPKICKNNIQRDTCYTMTKTRDMFQTLKNLRYGNEEAVLDWLIQYWQVSFLMTFPVYKYEHESYTFYLKTLTFEKCENEYSYFIEHGLYTIGSGVTLLLSLNAVGWITDEIIWNVLTQFIDIVDYDESLYNIPNEWLKYYYPHYLHIIDFPFLYAFQFCNPNIYCTLYNFMESMDRVHQVYYIIAANKSIYISNIFTVHRYPKNHHYDFLKKTKQSKYLIQGVRSNMHFNIYQHLITILQSSYNVKKFLSNGLSRRLLIHCIYKNKRLGLLKFIQSITYLYHNNSYSKRYLKYIWRNIMKEFNDSYIQTLYIYLVEYFLLESNLKSSDSLLCPPSKMLRDTMYILKNIFSLHKNIEISIIVAKKYDTFLRKDLFKSYPNNIYSSHGKYIVCISFLKLLELLKEHHPIIQFYIYKLNKKRMMLLQCLNQQKYSVYQIMQKYYCNEPDALWRI